MFFSVNVLGKMLSSILAQKYFLLSHLKSYENYGVINACFIDPKIVTTDFLFCIMVLEIKSQ